MVEEIRFTTGHETIIWVGVSLSAMVVIRSGRESYLWIPFEWLFATLLLSLLAVPTIRLIALGVGTLNRSVAVTIGIGAAMVLAPLFVAGYLPLDRLWDYVLVYVLGVFAFLVLGLCLRAVAGVDFPLGPTALEVTVVAVGHGTAIGLVLGRGVRI